MFGWTHSTMMPSSPQTTQKAPDAGLSFWSARQGAVLVIFAFLLFPILLLAGVTIDSLALFKARFAVQEALDSAALSGSVAATRALRSGGSVSAAKTAGDGAATSTFQAGLVGISGGVTTASFQANGTVSSSTATYAPTVTVTIPNSLMRIVGKQAISLNLSATATAPANIQYIDVYVVVDISGSMMLGATQSDINTLMNKFGCALACHDGSTSVWTGSGWGDSYQWAINNGVTLRYQVLFEGVTNLVNYMNSVDPSHTQTRLAVYSLDQALTQVLPLTYNYSNISQYFPSPAVDNSDTAGATLFNENINTVVSAIGNGGNGSSSSNTRKLLIIATDGVEDPGRQWTYNTWLEADVKAFDTSFCTTLKNNNVSVGIINTPYLPMTWDWGYNATLGQPGTIGATRVDDIAPTLQQCAGSLFISSSDTTTIQNAFTQIFQIFGLPHLTQ